MCMLQRTQGKVGKPQATENTAPETEIQLKVSVWPRLAMAVTVRLSILTGSGILSWRSSGATKGGDSMADGRLWRLSPPPEPLMALPWPSGLLQPSYPGLWHTFFL